MATEASRPLLTYDDYVALPDDGNRYELIDGELVLSPSATTRHQRLVMRLATELINFLDAHPSGILIGDVDTYLTRFNTLRPDLFYVSPDRAAIVTDRRLDGAPDLAVEVLSPGNTRYDLGRKKDLYAEHGVREYWTVHQDHRQVDVYRRQTDGSFAALDRHGPDAVLTTPILAGLSLPIAQLYKDLPDLT